MILLKLRVVLSLRFILPCCLFVPLGLRFGVGLLFGLKVCRLVFDVLNWISAELWFAVVCFWLWVGVFWGFDFF